MGDFGKYSGRTGALNPSKWGSPDMTRLWHCPSRAGSWFRLHFRACFTAWHVVGTHKV